MVAPEMIALPSLVGPQVPHRLLVSRSLKRTVTPRISTRQENLNRLTKYFPRDGRTQVLKGFPAYRM
jgi:hypothetical protein